MSHLVYRISSHLCHTLESVPLGTNLALYTLTWSMLSGHFIRSYGAITPSLVSFGLSREQTQRAVAALAYGKWKIEDLLSSNSTLILKEDRWKPHEYEGYRPVAADLTGFYRPQLKDNQGKHYEASAGRALPAITLGICGLVGSLKEQRLALPRIIMRPDKSDPRDSVLQKKLVKTASEGLAKNEALVVDAGFSLKELWEADCSRFVVRLAKNDTARRNFLPTGKHRGRHKEYGEVVRPLPKAYAGKELSATAPDKVMSWEYHGRTIRAEIWENLVGSNAKPGSNTFSIIAVYDPTYEEPLLLATNLKISAQSVWFLYKDRWGIEQVPLAGKKMLGGSHSFVHGEESRYRLPELVLFAGSLLSFIAASEDKIPTGYWDRNPGATIGRLRRYLSILHFSNLPKLDADGQIREKKSVHEHLPKGVLGHRRQKRGLEPETVQMAA